MIKSTPFPHEVGLIRTTCSALNSHVESIETSVDSNFFWPVSIKQVPSGVHTRKDPVHYSLFRWLLFLFSWASGHTAVLNMNLI